VTRGPAIEKAALRGGKGVEEKGDLRRFGEEKLHPEPRQKKGERSYKKRKGFSSRGYRKGGQDRIKKAKREKNFPIEKKKRECLIWSDLRKVLKKGQTGRNSKKRAFAGEGGGKKERAFVVNLWKEKNERKGSRGINAKFE